MKNASFVLLGICELVAITSNASAVDFVRQIQMKSGQAVVYDRPIPNNGGEIRSSPIDGDGSIFQLYAYDDAIYSPFSLVDATLGNVAHANVSLDSHLIDLNVIGVQIDVIIGSDSSTSSLPHLLAEKMVGAFIPDATIALSSQDPYFPRRTRADQPYSATFAINRLPTPGADIPAGVPKKVKLGKSYKLYHPTLHVPAPDGSGQGVYTDGLEFSLNGTYSIPEIYQNLPGASPTRVIGEETYTASVLAGNPQAQAGIGSATIQIWPVGTADVLGLQPLKRYQAFPSGVQVKLTDLYPDSVTYTQIYKGLPALGSAGYVIPSSVFSINTFAPQDTVVPLLDVDGGIQDDGIYTIEVLTITPFNHREPERVTYTTIDIKRSIDVNATLSTME